jgi:hypothetical protein
VATGSTAGGTEVTLRALSAEAAVSTTIPAGLAVGAWRQGHWREGERGRGADRAGAGRHGSRERAWPRCTPRGWRHGSDLPAPPVTGWRQDGQVAAANRPRTRANRYEYLNV